MITHHVYVHDRLGSEAVKEGFSWPGFLLTWVWAFHKHLWKTAAGLLLVQLAVVGAAIFARATDGQLWIAAALLVEVLCRVLVGIYGNYWRENSMDQRGFVFEASVPAESPAAAIERVLHAAKIADAAARQREGMPRLWPAAAGLAAVLLVAFAAINWPDRDEPVAKKPRPPAASTAVAPETEGGSIAPPRPIETRRPRDSDRRQPAPAAEPSSRPGSAVPRETADRPPASELPRVPHPLPPGTAPAQVAPQTAAAQRAAERSPAEKEMAWNRHFRPSPACVEPADWDTYVECTNQKIRARQAFEDRWAAGQQD